MSYTSWRGVVGLVKPTMRTGSLEELIRLLPEGIGVLPLFLRIQRGTEEEFREVLKAFEERVSELAELKVDLIHPEGAPPFMVHGYKGEERIVRGWEGKYKIPIFLTLSTRSASTWVIPAVKIGILYLPSHPLTILSSPL